MWRNMCCPSGHAPSGREGGEVNVLKAARRWLPVRAGRHLRQNVDDRAAAEQASGNHLLRGAQRFELVLIDGLAPDLSIELIDELEWRSRAHDAAVHNDGHALAEICHVLNDMRGENHHHVFTDL